MVRVFIKGGVWKNSEDEILKAAVMKYGKQQWARVASLLNRKSAKQCKARWVEWLDPSVRKVEWSRTEDERLLHLAKLLPAQWRTIGPLVGGRTAGQCQERYERLLDDAAMKAADNEGSSGTAAAAAGVVGVGVGEDTTGASAASSARRLRPGEIDPHPETRPARPDPIDMDEDEIEMLQEARARLANTQGKKAKRKERERMLNEAKRLADLQKRRELKQAGLLSGSTRLKSRGGKKKRREIDFGVEIPFHKPAPAGFHSTRDEDRRADSERSNRMRAVDLRRVNEEQYRSRDRAERDSKKREERRLRSLERSNMQQVVAEVGRSNDPSAARKRGLLDMPEPAVADIERERIAKLAREGLASAAEVARAANANDGGKATDALLGDYANRPLPTPMRSPASGTGMGTRDDVVLREASNLRLLQGGETPLLGGENPHLALPPPTSATGGSISIGGGSVGGAPDDASMATDGAWSTATPAPSRRDALGLNRPNSELRDAGMNNGNCDDDASVSASVASFATSLGSTTAGGGSSVTGGGEFVLSIKEMARAERKARKRARAELDEALASLPAPKFEYELAVPGDDENNNGKEEDIDEGLGGGGEDITTERDAAEIEAEELALLRLKAEKRAARRSTVVQRETNCVPPRPCRGGMTEQRVMVLTDVTAAVAAATANRDGSVVVGEEKMAAAERLLRLEVLNLLQHDARAHPVVLLDEDDRKYSKKGKKGKKGKKEKKRKKVVHDTYVPLPSVSNAALDGARTLLSQEFDTLMAEKIEGVLAVAPPTTEVVDPRDILHNTTLKTRENASLNHVYVTQSCSSSTNTNNGWMDQRTSHEDGNNVRIAALRTKARAIRSMSDTIRRRADKMESKLSLTNGGYVKVAENTTSNILKLHHERERASIEQYVYRNMMEREAGGFQRRMQGLEVEVKRLEVAECEMQKKYGDLLHERKLLAVRGQKKK